MGQNNRLFPLRVIGIGLLLIIMFTAAMQFGKQEAVTEDAQIIFCQTADDANCAVLLSHEYCIVIDSGEKKDVSEIDRVLQEHQIRQIDCLILTHPDKDHIGGAPALIEKYPVSLAIYPFCTLDDERFDELTSLMDVRHIPQLVLKSRRTLVYGDLNMQIYPPNKTYYENTNNYSIFVDVRHGSNRVLFTGDAEKERLKEVEALDLTSLDLLVLPHHGRVSEGSIALLERTNPAAVIVTALEPGRSLLDKLTSMQIPWYSTIERERSCLLKKEGGIDFGDD